MSETVRILVAEDDPDLLFLTTEILSQAGYGVLEASTGKDCLEAVKAHRPDIVLLDVMLPDTSGTEICKQIKTDETLRGTFVILMSGVRVSSDSQADGLDVGADGYIIKPIANRELLSRIRSVVRIKQAEDALREKEREQQKLISELREALADIKTLEGLIPICASCKKIKDDEGYWNQLEAYISKHTDAVFSHGLCPECAEKFRAEIEEYSKKGD